MFPRQIVRSYGTARKVFAPLVQGCVTRLKGLHAPENATPSSWPATSQSVVAPYRQAAKLSALPPSATRRGTSAEHAETLAVLEETARLGHVPADALIGRLHACHCDRLAEDRQQLAALEQELDGHLSRLDARFPVPPPPAPEKPVPPRGRTFGPISRDLRGTTPGSATRQ
ncbi:hypothetical protein [Novosphingobium sp.]|uniref:hypothetical protein n=1 Tax=Novosphingobium sp. TaxID=1874826 RepID=UPI0038B7369E